MKKTFIALVILSFCVPVFAGLSDIESMSAGAYPRGLAIADIYGKAANQLIVANFGEDTLIGQENKGEPASSVMVFSGNTRKDISAGKSPRGVASGDLDADGIDDLAVSNYADGTISLITEKGTLVTTLIAGKHPVGVAIGDINGDKKNDVAAAVYSENKVVVFLSSSDKSWEKIEIAVPAAPTDVTIGKIGSENALVSANYGAGSASIIKYSAGALSVANEVKMGGGVCKVELSDVTGDGINDLVAANFYDNTVSVLKGGAAGSLEEQVVYRLNGSRPNGMAVADINRDGLNDVVTANRDSDTIDILVQENGVLKLALSLTVTGDEKKEYGPVEAAIGDINGDGLNDIAFTHMRSNTVRVLYQVKALSTAESKIEFAEEMNEANTYNYPNPCSDKTTIRFSLAAPADVKIMITDLSGKPVWTKSLAAKDTRPGINNVDWNVVNDNNRPAANGVYLLNVFAGDKTVTKKIAVVR
ncbi:MAG TPA: FG-GAP-like repeat-containing protein [Candidatus Goldiibacteriota bacterium]|nr:FG-GAP-like repeat-containing protein [Candidatus Goldiibacteriota bacterium]